MATNDIQTLVEYDLFCDGRLADPYPFFHRPPLAKGNRRDDLFASGRPLLRCSPPPIRSSVAATSATPRGATDGAHSNAKANRRPGTPLYHFCYPFGRLRLTSTTSLAPSRGADVCRRSPHRNHSTCAPPWSAAACSGTRPRPPSRAAQP